MVNSEALISTTAYLTLYAKCSINRCRYNRVRLYMQTKACIATQSTASFRRLYCDRSIVSSKASSAQSAVECIFLHLPVSYRFLKALSQLPTSSSSFPVIPIIPSIFPSKLFLRTECLRKM